LTQTEAQNPGWTAFKGGFRAEISQLGRSRLFVALTLIQAVTFLFLVSLFGLTGSRAPTAIVFEDPGPAGQYEQLFIRNLEAAHHSFALRVMEKSAAMDAVRRGDLVAVITIPRGFSRSIAAGKSVNLDVVIDNVDTDMTEDIKRALPSAIVAFGRQAALPDIHVETVERDLISHDTGFIPYLVVSGLALDAFVIAGILSAAAITREFETDTIRQLAIAPVSPFFSIIGRIAATNAVACLAMLLPMGIVVTVYGVIPLHPVAAIGVLLFSCSIFSCVGILAGTALKRTIPATTLMFGLALPLYLCSNSLEPQRFDGERIWWLGHISPVYYVVGMLEQAFHGLRVTPESIPVSVAALCVWTVVLLGCSGALLKRKLGEV